MRRKLLLLTVLVLAIAVAIGLWQIQKSGPRRVPPPLRAKADSGLIQHSARFEKGLEKVTDGVWVAIGFGLANSILLEGSDGLIVVDTMTTREEAAAVLAEFRKISAKPIKAIVYTHNHADHIFGADVFVGSGQPIIYAHETTDAIVQQILTALRPIIGTRSLRMFGAALDPHDVVNAGIGLRLGMGPESTTGYVRPTRTFKDSLVEDVAGIRFRLIHAPGETDDQIVMWLPDKKVLICADNFYWTFPNLYTIRGTPFRSLKAWYRSLDLMRDLWPDFLVPCHTRPIKGRDEIQRILTDYRDAIQFVHDQALRGINQGMTPDELAEYVKLPPHLAGAPYLQPFYGKVSWSVKAMFAGHLGWFDGDAAHLQPLPPNAEAGLMARLSGGEDKLRDQARALLTEDQFQEALQLTGYLLRLNPKDQEAQTIRVKALTALAGKEQNPNARNYYLSEALEIREGIVIRETSKPTAAMLHFFPLSAYMDSLAANLDPVASADVNQVVGMIFPDAGEAFTIHVRWGVAEVRARSTKAVEALEPEILVRADSRVFKEMLGRLRGPAVALAGFEYPKGGAIAFGRFLKLFTPGKMKRPFEPYDG
jgi:alkyl sulfatase BDS1-like metallo-beta-lactamase superfamily hydrolase